MTKIDDNPNMVEWGAERWANSLNLKNATLACSDLVILCHGAAIKAGWYNDPETGDVITYPPAFLLRLVNNEMNEAFNELLSCGFDKHLPQRLGFEVEIADMLILLFSMCGALGLDIGNAIAEKLAFNLEREDHRPENRPAGYGAVAR